ncbi:MAG: hypothetical protein ABII23_03620 [bacterium]
MNNNCIKLTGRRLVFVIVLSGLFIFMLVYGVRLHQLYETQINGGTL